MKKGIIITIIALAALVFVIQRSLYIKAKIPPSKSLDQEQTQSANQTASPKIVSTKPDPLEEAIISANEVLEISFNRTLENVGEFKARMDPEVDFKIELSGDRKTAKIIPLKPYELGTSYTLFIGPETKFDGVGRWGEEKVFHFKTIRYRGI